jgi:hypothetical protein
MRARASGNLLQETERVTGWHRHGHDYVVVCLTAGKLLAETEFAFIEIELK